MYKGKKKCEVLRTIRKSVAEKYGLEYSPVECLHEGDCPGTCPVCDRELQDLQRQLDEKYPGVNITDVTDLFSDIEFPFADFTSNLGGYIPKLIRESGIPEISIRESGILAPEPDLDVQDIDDDDHPF